jgi:hypothetical protein
MHTSTADSRTHSVAYRFLACIFVIVSDPQRSHARPKVLRGERDGGDDVMTHPYGGCFVDEGRDDLRPRCILTCALGPLMNPTGTDEDLGRCLGLEDDTGGVLELVLELALHQTAAALRQGLQKLQTLLQHQVHTVLAPNGEEGAIWKHGAGTSTSARQTTGLCNGAWKFYCQQ